MSELALIKRCFERERAARKEAESLLEIKSREAYEANQQLREMAEQTKSIVETAAEGIITYKNDGAIKTLNRSAQSIFHCDKVLELNIRDLFQTSCKSESALFPASASNSSAQAEWNLGNGEGNAPPGPVEVVGRRSTGEIFVAEISVSRTSIAEFDSFTALVRDLTRRKSLESRLSQAKKLESVGQLAAGVAHEINTPIQYVSSNVQFLKNSFEELDGLLEKHVELVAAVKDAAPTEHLLDQMTRYAATIDLPFLRDEVPVAIEQSIEGVNRVSRIVQAMKEFSQPSSGQRSRIDINRAIENALTVFANQYREIATVTTELDTEMPKVIGLGAPINQAILNILANAVEAIGEGDRSEAGAIRISTTHHEQTIEIRFEDNGPGIPAEYLDRIFDPFYTTKDVGKGTGEGLAFVYDVVVNKHAGAIRAYSPTSGGATLVVTLPLSTTKYSPRRANANSAI